MSPTSSNSLMTSLMIPRSVQWLAHLMKIHLKPGYVPKRVVTVRQVPHHLQKGADEVLAMALASGVIVPVEEPTEWIAPAFFVKKSDPTKARMVTDFTALNRHVVRPVHPFPSPQDVIRSISSTSKVFAKLDATSGYFQIPLDEESSRLTTFLLPSGRYRYTRAPMGLSSSSDEFCQRSDAAVRDLPGVIKIVDDILVQASSVAELKERLTAVLKRCRAHGITLSKGKVYAGTSVKFAGFIVTASGVKPDPAKVKAIVDFPAPKDISGVRSFLGLANQLGHFVPNLAMVTDSLRRLLKKDTAWNWTPEIQASFDKTKELLSGELSVVPFSSNRSTTLFTDASCINGMGYVLMQEGKLIQAGSRSLIDAETRYSVIELEATALAWSILACKHYLLGCPTFTVMTDHRPLVGIFSKDLTQIDNARLIRLREKVMGFNFEVQWVEGKNNAAADALSRSPVPCQSVLATLSVIEDDKITDPALDELITATKADPDLQEIISLLQTKPALSKVPPDHPVRAYRCFYETLSIHESGLVIIDGHRIVVPKACRDSILRELHKPHAGIHKTRKLAKTRYYWPGMCDVIARMVEACEDCQAVRQVNPMERPFISRKTEADKPMDNVSVDLFELKGKHYLVMVDRFSSFPFLSKLTTKGTDTITRILTDWFNLYGWPKVIGSDGGPQFRDEFNRWCSTKGINSVPSSAYNPASNGLAESGVKRIKHLLEKSDSWASFQESFSAYKNVPMARGEAPPPLSLVVFFASLVFPQLSHSLPINPGIQMLQGINPARLMVSPSAQWFASTTPLTSGLTARARS
jgi:transposase InsO family protein